MTQKERGSVMQRFTEKRALRRRNSPEIEFYSVSGRASRSLGYSDLNLRVSEAYHIRNGTDSVRLCEPL